MSLESIFEQIDDVIVEQNERNRGHLGFSIIGDDDERKIWLNFHWCLSPSFGGRMLRLFDLGQRIEDQVVDYRYMLVFCFHGNNSDLFPGLF